MSNNMPPQEPHEDHHDDVSDLSSEEHPVPFNPTEQNATANVHQSEDDFPVPPVLSLVVD